MSAELSMYKLADLLQMKLEMVKGEVVGKMTGTLATSIGLPIPVNAEVTNYFSSDQFGVICHVMGDLYIIASHYPKMGGLSVFFIDASKVFIDGVKCHPSHIITRKMGLKEVLDSMKDAVGESYHYKNGWKTLTLPR